MKQDNNNFNLFLPVYINKDRLLDINSILFDGYSEFSETTLENESNNKNDKKSNVKAGANIKIFNLGSELNSSEDKSTKNKKTISLKRVQTTSSLLSNTINILKYKKILKNQNFKNGDFVEITGVFKNNSICDLLEQFNDMMTFAELASKLDKKIDNKDSKGIKEQIKQIKQMIKRKDDLERELVCEKDGNIYVIHLLTDSIYNSSIDNIYNNELTFFGQIKNISKDYSFFSDTQLSKFSSDLLDTFINSLEEIVKCEEYNFDFELMSKSNGKTVYELDLIAIYRKSK